MPTQGDTSAGIRLAELAGGLSLAGDLADGYAPGKVLRTALLAQAVARDADVASVDQRRAYFLTLVRFLGCAGFAHEEANHFGAGDDIAVRSAMALADVAQPVATVGTIARTVGRAAPLVQRVRAVARLLGERDAVQRHASAQCDASIHVAREFGLDENDLGVFALMARWDGRGAPKGLSTTAIPIAARLLHVADVLETTWHRQSWAAAVGELRRRRGGQLDPALVDVALAAQGRLQTLLERGDDWEQFLAAEPTPHVQASQDRLDRIVEAMGRMADLKTVHTLGHSASVGSLAVRVADFVGIPPPEIVALRRAAHLHDLGRLGVPNAIWDKPGPLSRLEREQAETHTHLTERILSRAPTLAPLALLCAGAHERLDGSGYHRRLPAPSMDRAFRVLAVADVATALTEARPHREALPLARVAEILRSEASAGKLDPSVVEATLTILEGRPIDARRTTGGWPRGLSDREVEVLRYLARGKTNREIASLLDISQKTVQHHIAHAYDKLGISSRAGAALFVMENGLLGPD